MTRAVVTRLQRALLALLFLATLARIVPIGYDAPVGGLFSSDEVDSISRAIKFARGDLLPIHANKPTHYAEVLALAYGSQYAVEHLFLGTTPEDFERRFFLRPFLFYASARFVTAGFAIATLSLLLWSLRRHGLGAQLLAMGLAALASSSVKYSHIAKEDALAQFWTFASFVATLEMLAAKRRELWRDVKRWLTAAGIAGGLAVSTKYNCFFAPLFPVVGLSLVRHDLGRDKDRSFSYMLTWLVGAIAVGFIIGTPAVVLAPGRFFKSTLASDIVSEVGHGLASLHYADKYGWRFFVRIWEAEFGLAWVSVLLAAGLFIERARGLRYLVLVPLGLYIATLIVAGHLDYQYAIVTTPIVAWMLGHEMTARAGSSSARIIRLGVVAFLALGLAQNVYRVTKRSAEYLGGDTRIAAGRWLEKAATQDPSLTAKPLLIVAPFYYRYHPAVAFTAWTYERLCEKSRAIGREGAYFERAKFYASGDTRPQFDAEFLDVKWHFRRKPGGTREFLAQPFSLSLADYAGKYAAVIVPEATLLYLEQDHPEAAGMVTFLRQIRSLPLLARFTPQPWRLAGPLVEVYAAPDVETTTTLRSITQNGNSPGLKDSVTTSPLR
ncbi:MAG: phospholipid carrier-dependent glycosyltransferase [Candidatus Sumerlaeaceae bacterium]|nr:phospholipid carrier-dependent glycosyltransferase [Candidatus Sumerlaeaceae bacterium]